MNYLEHIGATSNQQNRLFSFLPYLTLLEIIAIKSHCLLTGIGQPLKQISRGNVFKMTNSDQSLITCWNRKAQKDLRCLQYSKMVFRINSNWRCFWFSYAFLPNGKWTAKISCLKLRMCSCIYRYKISVQLNSVGCSLILKL